MTTTLEDALWEADAALKRLKPEQGRIARKNAREAMLKALRKARQKLDAEFPLERKPVKRRRKARPERATRGKQKISQQVHRQLLAAGVSPSQFIERGEAGKLDHTIHAPSWMAQAWRAGIQPSMIKEAVRSQTKRKRIETMVRLGL